MPNSESGSDSDWLISHGGEKKDSKVLESEMSEVHFNIKSPSKKNSNKSNSKLQKLDFSSPVPEGIAMMLPHGQVSRKKQRKVKGRMLRVLFDSGASGSIILSKHTAKGRTRLPKSQRKRGRHLLVTSWQTDRSNWTSCCRNFPRASKCSARSAIGVALRCARGEHQLT